jgi:hypothetical protein
VLINGEAQVCVVVDVLWLKMMSSDGAKVACVSVRHSSRDPGGGGACGGVREVG